MGRGPLLYVAPTPPDSVADSAPVGSIAPRVDTINIENKGDGDLRWTARVVRASPWLSLQPLGVYRDTVIVAATSGGVQAVPVVFRIHP